MPPQPYWSHTALLTGQEICSWAGLGMAPEVACIPSLHHHHYHPLKKTRITTHLCIDISNSNPLPLSFSQHTPTPGKHPVQKINLRWDIQPQDLSAIGILSSETWRHTCALHRVCTLAPQHTEAQPMAIEGLLQFLRWPHKPEAPPSCSGQEMEHLFLLPSKKIASLCLQRAFFHFLPVIQLLHLASLYFFGVL